VTSPGSRSIPAATVAARVDGRPATVAPNGQVRFTAPTGAETDLRLVVALRRPECTSPDAAG
jgi:hypothetical protein